MIKFRYFNLSKSFCRPPVKRRGKRRPLRRGLFVNRGM